MKYRESPLAVQAERRILLIRRQRVLLDYDLAGLYGVETRVLKQAVRRNLDRFPEDFMFELSDSETSDLVSQTVIPGMRELADLERKYDAQFKVVFDAIRQLMSPPAAPPKPEIGFHVKEDAVPYRIRRTKKP